MTTKTRNQNRTRTNRNTRNISPLRRIEIFIYTVLSSATHIVLGVTAMLVLLAIVVIGVLFVLVSTGILTTQHITYITGDSWQVFYLRGVEIHSIQLQGNYLQQIIDCAWGVFVSIAQSIGNLFA